jgi:hypothetical protein
MIRVARAAARVAISSALGAHRRACRFRALLARADRRHYGADKSFIHRNKSAVAYGPTTSFGNGSGIGDLVRLSAIVP